MATGKMGTGSGCGRNHEGDLILPKNFEEWVYVGSPLTPNALNGGQ
jgi:hypothetical protein